MKFEIGTDAAGKAYTLPLKQLVTSTLAVMAKKGAGKTATIGVLTEELVAARLPFVVLDPVGVHWGLRSTADGKAAWAPADGVVIFGGAHGDVPLDRTMGKELAAYVAQENVSAIIDLSELPSKAAWREFVRDFCLELFRLNKDPRAVILEEATEFVPQTRRPEMQPAYEAVERMVRLGRNRGLGAWLVSQRSAQVAKDCLEQIDVLIALRHTGTRDRAALVDTIRDDVDEAALAEFRSSVQSLKDGEAWVWWSQHGEFRRVRFRRRETYHAGATPTGRRIRVVTATPDLDALRARFAAVVAKADADDPKKLRADLAEAMRRLAVADTRPPTPPADCGHAEKISALEHRVSELDAWGGHMQKQWSYSRGALEEVQAVAAKGLEGLRTSAPVVRPERQAPAQPHTPPTRPVMPPRGSPAHIASAPATGDLSARDAQDLDGGQRKLLDALASFEPLGVFALDRSTLAVAASVRPTSGRFDKNVGALKARGLIDFPGAGLVALTDAGRAIATPTAGVPTRRELHERWMRAIDGGQARLLRALIDRYPQELTRDDLAAAAGVQATSGRFDKNVGALRRLGVVEFPTPGSVAATALLFPEGVPA